MLHVTEAVNSADHNAASSQDNMQTTAGKALKYLHAALIAVASCL